MGLDSLERQWEFFWENPFEHRRECSVGILASTQTKKQDSPGEETPNESLTKVACGPGNKWLILTVNVPFPGRNLELSKCVSA